MTHPPSLVCATLGAVHGFFTRNGGVSTGPYASLNGSLSGGDDPALVARNRALVADSLGLPAAGCLLGLLQVHGAQVVDVTAPWEAGAGPRADAMVTAIRGIGLGIITADCAPVLFADAAAGVIGAAHAGWRGAVGGVLEATLLAMTALGANLITACIGPCIAQDSYQVGADLRTAVLAENAGATGFFREDTENHWRFDLAGYCAARLTAAGAAVERADADTYDNADRFFSHRRRTHAGGGAIGHQISAIRL